MTASTQQSPTDAQRLSQAMDWLIQLEAGDAGTREAFETWLRACEENAHAYQRASQLWGSPLLGTAAAGLERQDRQARLRVRRSRYRSLASAASLLLAITVILLSDLPKRLQADHVTAVGQRQHLQLADGSRILLNTDTAFASQLDDSMRKARLLYGEAYFDIAQDRSRPFEVDAGPVLVSVRGTAFAVRYLNDETEVSVERGEVGLRTLRNDASLILGAGDSIRIGPDGFGNRRQMTDNPSQLAWVQGRLIFENCPLNKVLSELRRYYPGWIITTDERLADLSITGNYRLDDPLGAMRSLAQVTSSRLHVLPRLLILD